MTDGLHEVRDRGPRHVSEFKDSLSSLPWTSSRCRRLLRPLQSRVAALERMAAMEKLGSGEELCPGEGSLPREQPPTKRLKTRDGMEVSVGQRKGLQRTYSRKASSTVNSNNTVAHLSTKPSNRPRETPKAPQPGIVATPILRKVRYHEFDTAPASTVTGQEAEGTCDITRMASRRHLDTALNNLSRSRYMYSPSRYQLYEGILHDLDVLLHATSPRMCPAGKKSLLSMCLRKVPQYASRVETWEKLEKQAQGLSMRKLGYSLLVYDELEFLGGAGNGWGHLRVLLRAHGIHLLRVVVDDGTLDDAFVRILVNHCKVVGCHHESAELMESLLCRFHPIPPKTHGICENSTQETLVLLSDLVGDDHMGSYLLKTISQLLLQGPLSTSILSTKEFSSMWTASLSSILDGKTNPWAIRFVSTGLSILSTSSPGKRRTRTPEATSARENPALQTLIGVLGAISAMAMLSQNFGSAAGMAEKQRQDRTQKVVLQVVGEAIALVMSQGGGRESSYPLLLAAFLSSDTIETLGIATKTALQTIWFQENQARETSGMAKQPQLHSSTVALVCSIAHCCSKATSQPSSHYFAAVCKLAEELQIPRLRELRTDGAFLLAQETDDLRDLIFAETLMGGSPSEKGFTRHHRPRGALFSGYRWEEGISEWIAMSPAKRREIIANNDTVLRRSSRSGRGKKNASVVYSGPELSAEAAGAADESGPQMSMNEPDGSSGHHVDRRRAGKRKAVHDGPRVHNSRLEKDKAQNQLGNGVDELSATFQENHLGKSRLGSTAVKTWGGSQRRTRTGKTGRRKALADLTILTNVTGLDDDELGL